MTTVSCTNSPPDLPPCPFCGCEHVRADAWEIGASDTYSGVAECTHCGARIDRDLLPSRTAALQAVCEAWSARAPAGGLDAAPAAPNRPEPAVARKGQRSGDNSSGLLLWNGGASSCRKPGDPLWMGVRTNSYHHAYVAAKSRADARRVIAEYCGHAPGDHELKTYWSPCWGVSMDGITPERGLWLDMGQGPVRVV